MSHCFTIMKTVINHGSKGFSHVEITFVMFTVGSISINIWISYKRRGLWEKFILSQIQLVI